MSGVTNTTPRLVTKNRLLIVFAILSDLHTIGHYAVLVQDAARDLCSDGRW